MHSRTLSASDVCRRRDAKTKGAYKGRPPTFDHAKIVGLRKQGKGATEITRAVGCQRGNVYKALKASGLK
jgi:hypothetical protein